MVDGVDKRTEEMYLPPCRRGIAEMPLRRFDVEHNSLLEDPACAGVWPLNTSLVVPGMGSPCMFPGCTPMGRLDLGFLFGPVLRGKR